MQARGHAPKLAPPPGLSSPGPAFRLWVASSGTRTRPPYPRLLVTITSTPSLARRVPPPPPSPFLKPTLRPLTLGSGHKSRLAIGVLIPIRLRGIAQVFCFPGLGLSPGGVSYETCFARHTPSPFVSALRANRRGTRTNSFFAVISRGAARSRECAGLAEARASTKPSCGPVWPAFCARCSIVSECDGSGCPAGICIAVQMEDKFKIRGVSKRMRVIC